MTSRSASLAEEWRLVWAVGSVELAPSVALEPSSPRARQSWRTLVLPLSSRLGLPRKAQAPQGRCHQVRWGSACYGDRSSLLGGRCLATGAQAASPALPHYAHQNTRQHQRQWRCSAGGRGPIFAGSYAGRSSLWLHNSYRDNTHRADRDTTSVDAEKVHVIARMCVCGSTSKHDHRECLCHPETHLRAGSRGQSAPLLWSLCPSFLLLMRSV